MDFVNNVSGVTHYARTIEEENMKKFLLVLMLMVVAVIIASAVVAGCGDSTTTSTNANADVQKQLDDLKGALPKFAIPMREVGDRFVDMNAAVQGGNWALAAYMSKYMNNALNPAKVTKPEEYQTWVAFYTGAFDPVNKAISAKDMQAFNAAYTSAITSCNGCHDASGYKFVKIVKQDTPPDQHLDYTVQSEPTDVPK